MRGYQYGNNSKAGSKKVSQKDYNDAQAALASLKLKMSNVPKQQPVQKQANNQRFTPTFDIEKQMGGGGGYSKPAAKSTAAPKKKAAVGSSYGGGYGGGYGGSYGGGYGGGYDQPIGGGANYEDMNPGENEPTYPCPDCGRSFVASVLEKHKKICKKVFQKKRKAFDSRKKRMVDSEQMSLMRMGEKMAKNNPKLKKGGIPKWKAQSEEFRSVLRANRGLKMPQYDSFGGIGGMGGGISGQPGNNLSRYAGGRTGYTSSSSYGGKSGIKGSGIRTTAGYGNMKKSGVGAMPKQAFQPSVINNDFTLCKFCNRRYNDEAYHKHLPGCERRYNEAQIRNKITGGPKGRKK